VVPDVGLEPTRLSALDFESSGSTNSPNPAHTFNLVGRPGIEPGRASPTDFRTTIAFAT
jgi:hypothetical protein